MDGDKRRLRVEDATARKSHNVIEEAVGTSIGAVLVVNLGVDVGAIGGSDDTGCLLIILLSPAAHQDIFPQIHGWNMRSLGSTQLQGKEQSPVALKSCRNKVGREFSGLMSQQLRLYAENARRLLQSFDHMLHQLKLDRPGVRAAR